jgi:spectinomycin phosphotransferase
MIWNNMLEEPNLPNEKIIACLRSEYGLNIVQVAFLPLGADPNTAVYRVSTDDRKSYFLKLRLGNFDETSVMLPKFLKDQGIEQVIAPVMTRDHQLCTALENFNLILYPFVEGRDGFEVKLSARQWLDFGVALKGIHTIKIPADLKSRLQLETYSPKWRETVKAFLVRIHNASFDEPIAAKLAAFLKVKQDEIFNLVGRAERLGLILQGRSWEFVLCHYDIHAGNILIDVKDNLYIVDWDNPILAPKERDLMFIGGGIGGVWNTEQETELFYKGYGQTEIDPVALAYYRYERIIEDIAVYCEQIFLTDEGGEDREQSLQYLTSNFLPNNVLEIAYKSDEALREV